MTQNPSKSLRAVEIRFWNACKFELGLAPLERVGGIDLRSMAKVRAMACGSNPRALPDLRGCGLRPEAGNAGSLGAGDGGRARKAYLFGGGGARALLSALI